MPKKEKSYVSTSDLFCFGSHLQILGTIMHNQTVEGTGPLTAGTYNISSSSFHRPCNKFIGGEGTEGAKGCVGGNLLSLDTLLFAGLADLSHLDLNH